MARGMKVFALVAILVAAGLLMGREAYFYFAVFRPGIAQMIDAAERGDPAMQTELGMLYQAGGVPRRVSERPALFIHVPPDGSKAFYWYQRAATQGYAKGERFLSLAYAGGIGVQRNDPECVRWMARAANHGDPSAKMMYGRMFDKGYNGVSRDEVQAVKGTGPRPKRARFRRRGSSPTVILPAEEFSVTMRKRSRGTPRPQSRATPRRSHAFVSSRPEAGAPTEA